jgi:hypothetical protein
VGVGYVNVGELNRYTNLKPVTTLSSNQDVATVIDTYQQVISIMSRRIDHIQDIYCDQSFPCHYYLVFDKYTHPEFDLWDWLNSRYTEDVCITSANAGFLFPNFPPGMLSRGVVEPPTDDVVAMTGPSGFGGTKPHGFVDSTNGNTVQINQNFTESMPFIVGRSKKNTNYALNALSEANKTNIGRTHCKFFYKGADLYVEDLNSRNTTQLNGFAIAPGRPTVVNIGDNITIVDVVLRIV